MVAMSRRQLLMRSLQAGAVVLAPALMSPAASAAAVRPVGIQLYMVNAPFLDDPAGTLATLKRIGYAEVEFFHTGKLAYRDYRRLLDDAGLACPSAHLAFDPANLGAAFADAHALGARYATSSMLRALVKAPADAKDARPRSGMSLDEAQRTAELANRIGEAAARAGLHYVYHNHDFEFADVGNGSTGYDVLIRETDPERVQFEIDCGWMVFAGHDPVDYLTKFPKRIAMIHVKDFLAADKNAATTNGTASMLGAELGRGTVDYKPIFAAARKAGVKHAFAEQEGPFSRMNQLEAAAVAYDYLRSLR